MEVAESREEKILRLSAERLDYIELAGAMEST